VPDALGSVVVDLEVIVVEAIVVVGRVVVDLEVIVVEAIVVVGRVVVVLEVIVVEAIVVVGRVVFVSSAGVVLDSAVVSRSTHADRIRAKPSRAAIRHLRFATPSGEASCAPPRWCRCRCVPIPLTLHVHNKPTRSGKAAVRLDIATWFSARLANIRDVG
jgi:hypothetical protein